MKIKSLPVILIIICFMYGCKSENEKLNALLENKNKIENLNTYSLISSDTAKIRVNSKTYNFFRNESVYKDSIFIGNSVYNNNATKIEFFDLLEKKQIKTLDIRNFNIKSAHIGKVYTHNLDSIFILSFNNVLRMILINSKGEIINTWNSKELKKTNNNLKLPFEMFTLSTIHHNIKLIKDKMYFILEPNGYDSHGEKEHFRLGVYNIKTKEWEEVYGKYKGVLAEKGNNYVYSREHHVSYQLIQGDRIYISYPIDHYVYIYDLESKKYLHKKNIADPTIKKLPKPIKRKRSKYSDNIEELNDLYIKSPFYGPLNYHADVKMYSRYSRVMKNDGMFKISVQIFDEEFKLMGNTELPKYIKGPTLATSKGYLCTLQQFYIHNPDYFTIYTYNIHPKK